MVWLKKSICVWVVWQDWKGGSSCLDVLVLGSIYIGLGGVLFDVLTLSLSDIVPFRATSQQYLLVCDVNLVLSI